MNDFEEKLKETPRKIPGAELDRRIAELFLTEPAPSIPAWRSVGVGWAAAACVLAGFAGFVMGGLWQKTLGPTTASAQPPITFQVVYTTQGSTNPFDLTSVDDFRTTKPWIVNTTVNEGDRL
jgi:hypothetical protein